VRVPFAFKGSGLLNQKVNTINGNETALPTVALKAILPADLKGNGVSNLEKEVTGKTNMSTVIKHNSRQSRRHQSTYNSAIQSSNSFGVKPGPLAKSLLRCPDCCRKELFNGISFHPQQTLQQAFWLWSVKTSKSQPSTVCQ